MYKLFHKKLNKKGFTLAELLVVIAIIAILVAIAIPVFTNMVADAQLRVNQANVRSVRSAAVTKILTSLDEHDSSGSRGPKLNKGVKKGNGWVAVAEVDNAGNVNNLKVWVYQATSDTDTIDNHYVDAIFVGPKWTEGIIGSYEDRMKNDDPGVYYPMPEDPTNTNTGFAAVNPTTGGNTVYTVQVVIKDLDIGKETA